MSFFDKFTGKDKDKDKKHKNPFANVSKNVNKALGGGPKKFSGHGNSLGGSNPGKVMHVELTEQGPLGMKIEKRPNSEGTAIVSMVVAGSQAERAGLQRGDIVCMAGTNGEEELMYNLFIDMAASPQRPLVFDIRRIETKVGGSSSSGGGGNKGNVSAEAFARKQAVIAAAEKREKARKALEKPVKRKIEPIQPAVDMNAGNSSVPQSEAARRAVEAAKRGESQLSDQLGYNPYETNKSTAGQARNATTATKHGTVDGGSGPAATAPIPKVAPPKEALVVADDVPDVSTQFQQAFEECVTTNDHLVTCSSFNILRKLLTNATTKEEDKFKRVRLANAKIRAAITDVHGALDIMMACGFLLTEQDEESVLVYPATEGNGPAWLPRAMQLMQQYENSAATAAV